MARPAAQRRRSGPASHFVIDNDGDLAALERRAPPRCGAHSGSRARLTSPAVPLSSPPPPPRGASRVERPGRSSLHHRPRIRQATTAEPAVVQVGITDYAQGELGDVVFVNLPKPGDKLDAHQSSGRSRRSRRCRSSTARVAGEVVEVNAALDADPASVNRDPYGDGWMITLRVADPDGARRPALPRGLPDAHRRVRAMPEGQRVACLGDEPAGALLFFCTPSRRARDAQEPEFPMTTSAPAAPAAPELDVLHPGHFAYRHIGPRREDLAEMLQAARLYVARRLHRRGGPGGHPAAPSARAAPGPERARGAAGASRARRA